MADFILCQLLQDSAAVFSYFIHESLGGEVPGVYASQDVKSKHLVLASSTLSYLCKSTTEGHTEPAQNHKHSRPYIRLRHL